VSVFSEIGVQHKPMTSTGMYYGLDLAEVVDVKDPESLNRVRCKVITAPDAADQTNWAIVASFMGGKETGATFFPSLGDRVLLGYLSGDTHRPVVLSGVWTADVKRPYNYDKDGKNPIRSIKTASGAEILIDDTQDKEKIEIITKSGTRLSLDDGSKQIELSDKDGKNSFLMLWEKGEATIQAEKKLTLKAGTNATLVLDGTGGKLDLEGKNGVAVKGASIQAEAQGEMKLKSVSGTLESSGMLTIKGSMTKIN
jgi:uncharacterized protein involved in type VI secretion and phage assembly